MVFSVTGMTDVMKTHRCIVSQLGGIRVAAIRTPCWLGCSEAARNRSRSNMRFQTRRGPRLSIAARSSQGSTGCRTCKDPEQRRGRWWRTSCARQRGRP